MANKVLILGGLGSIGFQLAKSLAEQNNFVTIADNQERGIIDSEVGELLKEFNIIYQNIDITDQKEFDKLERDYDYVYHLAMINGTKNFYERPVDVLNVGVRGTINVLEWFKLLNKSKILFASSNEAYASWINLNGGPIPTPETVPLCIDNVFNPRWSYGGSKLIGEILFTNYGKKFEFPYTIVRYHNSYGPRMGKDHVIPQFINKILNKEDPFIIKGGEETRAFCYIDDTIRATQMAMESDKTNGEILHIGNNDETRIKDLAEVMFYLFEWRPNKVVIEPAPEGSVKRRCPDLTKINKLVGYKPKVSLKEGLIKTYKYYEQENNKVQGVSIAQSYPDF